MVSARQLVWTALVCATRAVSQSQSSSFITVDDSEAFSNTYRYGIQYGPGWAADDTMGDRYHGTYTSTQAAGSYMTFLFRGTGITYFADRAANSGRILLSVDGNLYTPIEINSTNTQYQQAIFAVSGLTADDHQIVIGTEPAYINETGVVGLDFFGVTPIDDDASYVPEYHGPGAWIVPSSAIIVDNEDPAITYSDDSWRLYDHPTNRPSPLYFNGTQRSSQIPGSSATFTFHGTSVYYFSDDFWDNTNVSVSIDGSAGDIIDTSTGVTWMSQRMFWSRAGLPDTEHVVTVTHVGKQGDYANVDFFMYTPSSPASSTKHVPIAAIVGGVVGGVVGLGLVLLGLFLFYRKRKAAKHERMPEETKPAPPASPTSPTSPITPIKAAVHHLTLARTPSRDSDISLEEMKVSDDKAIV